MKFLVILLIVASTAIMTITIVQLNMVDGAYWESSYYGTDDFHRDYGRVSHNAIEKYLYLISEKHIVSNEIDEAETNAKIRRIRTIDENLSKATGFIYVLENRSTGEIITNISGENPRSQIQELGSSVLYEYGDMYFPEGSTMGDHAWEYAEYGVVNYPSHVVYLGNEIITLIEEKNAIEGNDWRYYTAIMDPIPTGDVFFYEDNKRFSAFKKHESLTVIGLSFSSIMILICLIYLAFVLGKRSSSDKVYVLPYDEIPHELQLIIMGALFAPFAAYLSSKGGENLFSTSGLWIVVLFAEIGMIGVLLQYMSVVRLLKAKQFFSKLAMVRFIKAIVGLIQIPRFDRTYKAKIAILTMIWLFINGIICIMFSNAILLGIVILVLVNGLALKKIYELIEDLRGLMTTIHNRRLGEGNGTIDVNGLSKSLRTFGEDLEALQEGLELALEDRVRGEKLKTELITNVTHDLKNPLTSIISYVELLKTKDTYDDDTKKYIGVLDEKADRLKGLIDQLVDASKASSGNVEVNLETVDMLQLSRQLCGEFVEKLEKRSLGCVMPELSEPHYVSADPMILYRILENLMSNVCKYSMAGTRVYVDLHETDTSVIYGIKNISKEALNINVDDLSQRFVRGDSSRNTEGSGLGLSIALSLAKLIGARLTFEIDGDLFKAILTLKKSNPY